MEGSIRLIQNVSLDTYCTHAQMNHPMRCVRLGIYHVPICPYV